MIASISLAALNSSRRQNGCMTGVTHAMKSINSLLPNVKLNIRSTAPSNSTTVPNIATDASSISNNWSIIFCSSKENRDGNIDAKLALRAALVSANRGARECSRRWKSESVDDATNALVFAKPPFRVLLRDVSRGIARDYARVVGKHPQLLVAVFVLGVWLGACAVGAAFFFTGDYAAAKQWREFIARNADAIRAANAAAAAADASKGKKTN